MQSADCPSRSRRNCTQYYIITYKAACASHPMRLCSHLRPPPMRIITAGLLVRRRSIPCPDGGQSIVLSLIQKYVTMSSPSSAKRKGNEGDISPPPIKRKLQSHTNSMYGGSMPRTAVTVEHGLPDACQSEEAISNFFTPTSQKPRDRTTWSERAAGGSERPTLLVGRYEADAPMADGPAGKRRKIAAFDLVRMLHPDPKRRGKR